MGHRLREQVRYRMKFQLLTLSTLALAVPEGRLRRAGAYQVPTYRWKYSSNVPDFNDSFNSATGSKWTEPSRWGSSLFGGDGWGSSWGRRSGSSWNRWG